MRRIRHANRTDTFRQLFIGLIVICACWVTGCASSNPPAQIEIQFVADPLEQSAIHAVNISSQTDAAYAIDQALEKYQRQDDVYGQWRIHYLATKVALRNQDNEATRIHLAALNRLASQLDYPNVRFRTALINGVVSHNNQYFEAALGAADNSLQEAVAYAYLGQTQRAFDLLETNIEKPLNNLPADRAFVYYQYAKANSSSTDFARALSLYQFAEDSRGVADCLVNLARLSATDGQKKIAADYAYRAISVLTASGDSRRASAIENWLENLE